MVHQGVQESVGVFEAVAFPLRDANGAARTACNSLIPAGLFWCAATSPRIWRQN